MVKRSHRKAGSASRVVGVSVVLALAGQAVAAELLVTSRLTNQVLEFDASTGAFVGIFAGAGKDGSGLQDPRGILLGSDGNIYVASYATDSVKKYSATGTYIGDFVTSGSGGLDGPDGMTWGPDGNLYISSSLNHRVLRYQGPGGASPGAFIDTFVTAGSGGLNQPRGLMFGNDQFSPGPVIPGPAQDGYPELLVCSWGSGKILRYNGQATPSLAAGAFLDVYADAANVQHLIFERFVEDSWRYDRIVNGNILASLDAGNLIGIYSGTYSKAEHFIATGMDTNFYGPFYVEQLSSPRGLAWGPDRGSNGNVGSSYRDGFNDLAIANYIWDNIRVAGADESDLGILVAAKAGGLDGPSYLLFKCGDKTPTLVRRVVNNNALLGSTHTLRLQGDNLASITAVRLRKMRDSGSLASDGTGRIDGFNLRMDGNDVLVDFNLTVNYQGNPVECGRYMVQPFDSCGISNWMPDTVLVYAPELLNTSFEEGYVVDPREANNVCENPSQWDPNGGGNKTKPKHWDVRKYGWQTQLDIKRDGNVWHPCTSPTGPGSYAEGMTGDHYGSIHCNISNDDEAVMWQTIAAPDVSTKPYRVYVDAHMASFERLSYGYIRLIDGIDRIGAGVVIAETQIPNTQTIDDNAIVRSPDFVATVPQGYVFQSDPPLLTVMFVLKSVTGDVCPAGSPDCGYPTVDLALKGLHLDAVRNTFQPCPNSPWADTDNDDDVDSDDFAFFQRCLTVGDNQPMDPACQCLDRNGDNLIDIENDFVQFQLCGTGPGVTTVAPGCE